MTMPVPLANQVLEHVRGERQLLIELLEELTAAESPSKHPDIHDRIRTSLVTMFADLDFAPVPPEGEPES